MSDDEQGNCMLERANEQSEEKGRSADKFLQAVRRHAVRLIHRDTKHSHLHIAAYRIGFDGRTANDNNNYKKIAAYCRNMELKYDLKQVLSPRRLLSQEQRLLPRHDTRKEAVRNDVAMSLSASENYVEFERLMKEKKYKVIKACGIAFIDEKKVYVKGSEVGIH
ncbi:MAG TPA: relaxase/mobilization nuclease domain-containing protein [Parafilimonas sp.]|nr:relaxase/mobilization nuclease domain-containing protein [Parafilimonas sp.]